MRALVLGAVAFAVLSAGRIGSAQQDASISDSTDARANAPQSANGAREMAAASDGPKGLRLRWRAGELEKEPSLKEIYITWRTKGSELSGQLVTKGTFGVEHLELVKLDSVNPESSLAITGSGHPYDGWYADFGEGALGSGRRCSSSAMSSMATTSA